MHLLTVSFSEELVQDGAPGDDDNWPPSIEGIAHPGGVQRPNLVHMARGGGASLESTGMPPLPPPTTLHHMSPVSSSPDLAQFTTLPQASVHQVQLTQSSACPTHGQDQGESEGSRALGEAIASAFPQPETPVARPTPASPRR